MPSLDWISTAGCDRRGHETNTNRAGRRRREVPRGYVAEGRAQGVVTEGFADTATGRNAVVNKNACVVLLPDSTMGQMAFVVSDGTWGFVRGDRATDKNATFADAALKSIVGSRNAEPDALGKLRLKS
jgi:hypothetical protein